MNDDIVLLLQDLGRDTSVDVIANFLIRNPELEDLIAAKMGSLLSAPTDQASPMATDTVTPPPPPTPSNPEGLVSRAASLIPYALSMAIAGSTNGSHKMVFVVNMDLNMGRGKQCAQVAHAALGLYLKIQESGSEENQLKVFQWIAVGQKKIVVKGNNFEHLKKIQEEAEQARLPNILISDAGCTQIAPGSKTVLAIFGTNEELDKITGSLRLL